MTIEEIEQACSRSQTLDFTRHPLEAPELTLRETFYPMGFPTEVRTNSPEILAQAHNLWRVFEKRFETAPICVDVHVVEGQSAECPPSPVFHMQLPLLINIADADNFSVVDLERSATKLTVARGTLKHENYLGYFLLGSAPLCHIATRYATPVHAACVAFEGRGMLLCGDSGAGKSTLSYACARAGWTYITDDATYLINGVAVNGGPDRSVTGNCHQVRFRPTAGDLFPEINGREITPRAAGKPSIELPTAGMPWIACSPTAEVNFLVFLNRRMEGRHELVPYSRDVARYFMRQVLYGSPSSLATQYETLERLLSAEIYELRYTDLDWAVHRLESLAREGAKEGRHGSIGSIAAD